MQLTGRLPGTDVEFLDMKYRTAIEPGRHRHQADTGLLVPGKNRRLDRRGAAPAGQNRRVNVEAAVLRNIENGLRQDQPVCRHDQEVRPEGGELRLRLLVAQRLGLPDRDAALLCKKLDRARRQLLAAAGRSIRLGQHGDRAAARVDECLQ